MVVSRGELVEIGGGFRIPDVLRQSGATLVEVGTDQPHPCARLRRCDQPQHRRLGRCGFTPAISKQIGFVKKPDLTELVEIAHAQGAAHVDVESETGGNGKGTVSADRPLVIDDLGSGTLLNTARFGLAPEPMVQSSVQAGADIITFSGDKLLGGPQAGLIVGKAEFIARLRSHPLARAPCAWTR